MKKGFTLIELLVVVLIIGILSSAALPQYQKAVAKSRAAEAWNTLGAIETALQLKRLADGKTTQSPAGVWVKDVKQYTFEDLDLPFDGATGKNYDTKHWSYSLESGSGAGAEAWSNDFSAHLFFQNGSRVCQDYSDGESCTKLGIPIPHN